MTTRRESAAKWKRQGLKRLRNGQLAEAREALAEACRLAPRDAQAWSLLGTVHGRLGDAAAAVEACRRSLEIAPGDADTRCNLGIALETLDRDDEAIACYRQVISAVPAHLEARKNLAGLLAAAGRPEEAVAHFETALRRAPGHAGLHNDLANALVDLGRLDEAERHYRTALDSEPGLSQARINLAALRFQSGERESAMDGLDRLLAESPDDPVVHHNLAEMLQRVGLTEQALRHYDEALRLNPGFIEARNHRGTVLHKLARHDEARADFAQALAQRPDYAEAFVNLAQLELEDGRIEAAETAFRRAIAVREGFAEAWNGLGNCLVQSGQAREGIAAYERAQAIDPAYREAASNRLLALHYDPAFTPERLYAAHREWGAAAGAGDIESPGPSAVSSAPRRLRIGYVSPDFRTHSVAAFIEPILRAHDPDRFEVICYAEVAVRDETSNRIAGLVAQWVTTCGMDDAELIERIRRDRIDILVDLAGHTAHNRLGVFARRAAPVQMSYLGYPDTTGLVQMDYRLSDEIADPPGREAFHTERLLRLPSGFLCYGPPADAPAVATRPAGASGPVTLASFNNLAKVNESVIAAWVEILNALPDARLLLKSRALGDESVRRRCRERFAAHGVDPRRLRLLGWTGDQRSHLALYAEVDIALDTFPYNGTTTSCEALWMGVPVVTLEGSHHAGRVGRSLLHRLGLDPLCTPDTQTYVERVVELAHSPEKRETLRTHLRPLMRVRLCDALAFTRTLEQAYRQAWEAAADRREAPVEDLASA